jgi:hypothetical protein
MMAALSTPSLVDLSWHVRDRHEMGTLTFNRSPLIELAVGLDQASCSGFRLAVWGVVALLSWSAIRGVEEWKRSTVPLVITDRAHSQVGNGWVEYREAAR